MAIDTAFDFRSDTPNYPKADPDSDSRTLRQYHKLLWSKVLPGGARFDLSDAVRGAYLHHKSELGEFFLASDSVIPTYTRWGFAKEHPELYTADANESFMALAYTIGGMMIFPGNRIDGKWTINQARGCLSKISDRFDLTLECIRRHYRGEGSPLAETLSRYCDFFALFENFDGYVNYFLLQDLVSEDCCEVKYFMPFDDFAGPATPNDASTYSVYRGRSIEFVAARNRRIARDAAARS